MSMPMIVTATDLPTWEDLVEREPRLADLRVAAERIRPTADASFCANAVWYGYGGHLGLKPRLIRLVGWGAQIHDPVLRSSDAYDVAYQTLYHLLPDCRGCSCVDWSAA
ncbi:MAG: hypothetical protein M3Q71_13835 [Chloroflexota bacterium]|nr:hypothetical protein [Chloroflexota bacterium]